MEQKGEIILSWIDGKNQIADCIRKSGTSSNKLLDVLESTSTEVVSRKLCSMWISQCNLCSM